MAKSIYELLPQLKSVSQWIRFYMANTASDVVNHHNKVMQRLLEALDKNVYLYAKKNIGSYNINYSMSKPLFQGTVHKYTLDQLKISNWLNNYFNYNLLKTQVWENFRQIAYTFNGIKDYYDVLLKL